MRAAIVRVVAPALVAIVAVTWHELGIREHRAAHGPPQGKTLLYHPGPHPARLDEPARERAFLPRQSLSIAQGSVLRFQLEGSRSQVRVTSLHGTLELDEHGLPATVDLTVDLRELAGVASAPTASIAWHARESTSGGRLRFHGRARFSRLSAVRGVADVLLDGSLQVGGLTRRDSLQLRLAEMPGGKIHAVGAGTALASTYGLPRARSFLPLAEESRLCITWDLVFSPTAR